MTYVDLPPEGTGGGGGTGPGTVTQIETGTGLIGGPITTTGTISLDASGVTTGTYTKVTVDTYGRVTSGASIGSSDVTSALGFTPANKAGDTFSGNVILPEVRMVGSNSGYIGIKAPADAGPVTFVMPAADGVAGTVLGTDGSGNLAWVTRGTGSVTSITAGTGLSGGTITTSGTISLGAAGTAGTYTKVTTDAYGRVTSGTSINSSDVTTALGFTPVNKAGDTMSGALAVPANGFTVGTTQIVASGNQVGIGTATPLQALDVASESSAIIQSRIAGGASVPAFYGSRSGGTLSSPTAVTSAYTLMDLVASGYDGSTFVPAGYIRFACDASTGSGDMPGRIVFATTADGASVPTERMRIDKDGNIGIGTTPSYKVDVRDTQTTALSGTITMNVIKDLAVTGSQTGIASTIYASIDSTNSGSNSITSMIGVRALSTHGGTGASVATYGLYAIATASSSGPVTNLRGAYNAATVTGSGTVSNALGSYGQTINSSSTATVTNAYGSYSYTQNSGTGTMTSAYGSYNFVANSSTGTITTGYGVVARILNSGGGTFTTGYGVYVLGSSGVTNPYGVYQVGSSDTNYFAASTGFGVANPSARIHIDGGTGTASSIKFSAGSTTGNTSTDGFDIGITATADAEIRQREAKDIIFYANNAEAMRLTSAGNFVVPTTVTAGGTTGNQTINKLSGTVNIAAGLTTITVTNSLVSANSIVFAVVRTNDATAYIRNVVCSAGSFAIKLGAAATAETSIGFFVVN